MMICREKTALDDHAILRIQAFSSLLSSDTQAPFSIFHLLPKDGVLAMALINQQTDGISHNSGVCAFLPLIHTPPQVDEFGCKNRRIKAVGRRKQRACISPAWHRFLPISFAKKALAHFFRRQFSFARKNRPTYFYPTNWHKKYRNQRRFSDHGALTTQDWPIYGGDQEKNGDQKSDKKKTDKTKSDKSKRENDKGLRKIKPPKRDGLASILAWPRWKTHITHAGKIHHSFSSHLRVGKGNLKSRQPDLW